jgi:acyl-CoA thioester hydrolase
LYNEKNELLNVGVTTLVFLDAKTKQKAGLPADLKKRLEPFFEQA